MQQKQNEQASTTAYIRVDENDVLKQHLICWSVPIYFNHIH